MAVEFFLDRGMGSRIVPLGLRDRGWIVTTMDERYGVEASQAVSDADWIRDAAGRDEVLICKDRKVAKRPLEADAIYYSDARVLVLADARVTGHDMLARLVHNEASIQRLCQRPGPWVYGVYGSRLAGIRLNRR